MGAGSTNMANRPNAHKAAALRRRGRRWRVVKVLTMASAAVPAGPRTTG